MSRYIWRQKTYLCSTRTIIRRWGLKLHSLGHKDIIITKLLINVNISLFASKCLLEYPQMTRFHLTVCRYRPLATGNVTGRSSEPLYDYSTFTVPVPIWFNQGIHGVATNEVLLLGSIFVRSIVACSFAFLNAAFGVRKLICTFFEPMEAVKSVARLTHSFNIRLSSFSFYACTWFSCHNWLSSAGERYQLWERRVGADAEKSVVRKETCRMVWLVQEYGPVTQS
jgi:hypothetical protein